MALSLKSKKGRVFVWPNSVQSYCWRENCTLHFFYGDDLVCVLYVEKPCPIAHITVKVVGVVVVGTIDLPNDFKN